MGNYQIINRFVLYNLHDMQEPVFGANHIELDIHHTISHKLLLYRLIKTGQSEQPEQRDRR
jgi:hypothetical protein